MTCGDDPCDAIREEFANAVAQAIDALTARVVTATYTAVCVGEEGRDYLNLEDVEAIQQFVATTTIEQRWPPPSIAEIVEVARRLDVPVLTEN